MAVQAANVMSAWLPDSHYVYLINGVWSANFISLGCDPARHHTLYSFIEWIHNTRQPQHAVRRSRVCGICIS